MAAVAARAPTDPVQQRSRSAARWPRYVPWAVLVAGAMLFIPVSLVVRHVADQSEQHLLQQQTDEAGQVLAVAVTNLRAPLDAAARAAASTNGDADVFTALAKPLAAASNGGNAARLLLFRPGSLTPITQVGDGAPALLSNGPSAAQDMMKRSATTTFVVVNLVQSNNTLGYAVADATPPHYVVYLERTLANPNVRQRTQKPFDKINYAIYLGKNEQRSNLIGSSLQDPKLPIRGRRAVASIDFGDTVLTFVTTPIGRIGSALLDRLWWIVLVAGSLVTIGAALLVRGIDQRRHRAVGLAEENARLYTQQREVAETLQLSLLPQQLIPPPGSSVAARYWPASRANLIGGDFYDVFAIDDGHWGFVIGDVCGHGIEAASLTGLIRYTLRSASRYTTSPAEALRAVHLAMADHQPATFCTVCFLVYTVGSEGDRAMMALAGHPQPLLATANTVRPIGAIGTLLGLFEPKLHDEEVDIGPGDTLLLYTDGLTDAPRNESVSNEELEGLLAQCATLPVERVADRVGEAITGHRPDGRSNDDTAILVVRF